jgi:hypothetical protein
MIDSERVKLLYGPYRPPRCKVGENVTCEYHGREMVVSGMTDAPISWPQGRSRNGLSVIVCGDLVRAIRTESAMAVAYHWGVHSSTVSKWRKALGVPRMTNGTRRLRIEWTTEIFTPEFRAKGREAMHRPDVRAKLSALRKGRRQHPNTIEACRRLGQRPKSDAWKRALSERSKKMWENPEAHGLPQRRKWAEDELALLGADSDNAVARALGLPVGIVRYKRQSLGIFSVAHRWSDGEIALLGTAPDAQLARTFGKPVGVVQRKRLKLGIPAFVAKPWSKAEIALLGTASDYELGRRLGRHQSCVHAKREQLGIPAFFLRWTKAELSLLGTDTDRNIARLLQRTEMAVSVKRKKCKIPAYC